MTKEHKYFMTFVLEVIFWFQEGNTSAEQNYETPKMCFSCLKVCCSPLHVNK